MPWRARGAGRAAGTTNPVISAVYVSASGQIQNQITVIGTGFGTNAQFTTGGCNNSFAGVLGPNLHVTDITQGWSDGCVKYTPTPSWSDTKVVFSMMPYTQNGAYGDCDPPPGGCSSHQYWFHPGDSIQVTIINPQTGGSASATVSDDTGSTLGGGSLTTKKTSCEQTTSPVNCATGDFWHTFDDLTIPGRGMPLHLTHTYNSLLAGQNGPLGFGWTDSYNMFLTTDGSGMITVNEEAGSSVVFTCPTSPCGYVPASGVLGTLVDNGNGTLTFTRIKSRQQFVFNAPTTSAPGQLVKEIDRNGYTTTLSYSGGLLHTATDPAGRSLTFNYAGSLISSVSDGTRTVSFQYNDGNGNLTDAFDVAGGHWHFTYDANHLLLTMTDPVQETKPSPASLVNVYDGSGRVTSQTDQLNRQTTFGYVTNADASETTTITDPKLNVTLETYLNNELLTLTKGSGTPQQATWTFTYDPVVNGITSITDPNHHVTRNTWDSHGNLLTHTDALSRETCYQYDSLSDVTAVIDPGGVTTSMVYDANGNLQTVSRTLTPTSPPLTPGTCSGSSPFSAIRAVAAGAASGGHRDIGRGQAQSMTVVPAPVAAQRRILARAAGRAAVASPTGRLDDDARLPLRFEPNLGQTDAQVAYLAHGPGYLTYLTAAQAVLVVAPPPPPSAPPGGPPTGSATSTATATPSASPTPLVVQLGLVGANPLATPTVSDADLLPGVSNYLLGSDPGGWITGVPGYARVTYPQVYPGIDLVYHGEQGALEYDFVLAPHASVAAITMSLSTTATLSLDGQGNLGLAGALHLARPLAYQDVGGQRQVVPARYVLAGNLVRLVVGAYDASLPLVIDPTLVYSTYLGGSGADQANAVAIDSSGDAYVTGYTASTNFPTTSGGLQRSLVDLSDAFVAKLNAAGNALVYATYVNAAALLGSQPKNALVTVRGTGIALRSGAAYLVGSLSLEATPLIAGEKPTYQVVAAELNAAGSALVYHTALPNSTLGGNSLSSAYGYGLALDGSGNAYLTGAYNVCSCGSGPPSGFTIYTAKLDTFGRLLSHLSLGAGVGNAIAVDSSGNAFVTGEATSTSGFATSGAFQTSNGGGDGAFVAQLTAAGTGLVYGTYLGGAGAMAARGSPWIAAGMPM